MSACKNLIIACFLLTIPAGICLGTITLFITAIGWGVCSNTNYCPDPTYPYLFKIQSNPDVYVCAKYNYVPSPPNPSINASSRHCIGYDGWMWSFIGSLLIVFTCGLLYFLCRGTLEVQTEDPKTIPAVQQIDPKTTSTFQQEDRESISVGQQPDPKGKMEIPLVSKKELSIVVV